MEILVIVYESLFMLSSVRVIENTVAERPFLASGISEKLSSLLNLRQPPKSFISFLLENNFMLCPNPGLAFFLLFQWAHCVAWMNSRLLQIVKYLFEQGFVLFLSAILVLFFPCKESPLVDSACDQWAPFKHARLALFTNGSSGG